MKSIIVRLDDHEHYKATYEAKKQGVSFNKLIKKLINDL